MTDNTFTPGPTPNSVRSADGKVLTAPEGWILLPPGDAALTRRVKAACQHWVVQEKKGRKIFSRGVWAPAATIDKIRAELEAERSTEGYAKRKDADARRRDKAQAEYVEDFFAAVWLSWPSIPHTLISPVGWPVRLPIMPLRSAAAPSPGRNESRSKSGRRQPSLRGCGTKPPATIQCPSPESKASGGKFVGCLPSDPRSCWAGIEGENRSAKIVRSRRHWRVRTKRTLFQIVEMTEISP